MATSAQSQFPPSCQTQPHGPRETPTRSGPTTSSTWTALLATFNARCEIALGSKFPDLAATRDFVLAPPTAQLWAEAGPFDPTRKEAGVDLIQDGLRGHAAWGLCKDVQDGLLDGRW